MTDIALPDELRNPSDEFPHIVNRIGLYGNMPTLYYDGHPHRIPVTHPLRLVRHGPLTMDEFVDQYGPSRLRPDRHEARDEFRRAAEEALTFYDAHQEAMDELISQRETDLDNIES